jgi:2-polyprenyl-6-methoxyphenol hydroxylase-like FAD-dependent oxidoreductase
MGGGFAGLVTAGVLTSYYEQVTVVDRDLAPGPDACRRGASQGRHAHNLLPKGAQLIEEIFPGILGEMVADGAVLADLLAGYRFHVAGKELPQVSIGAKSVHATRPFYEEHLRRRLLDRDGVRLLLGADVVGVVADDQARTRIVGVRIMRREPSSSEETLAADLVVDAMGRSGRSPAWLEELGYERPREDRVSVEVAYASRMVRLTAAGAERAGHLVGGDNGTPRGILLLAVDGGRHVLTLTGSGQENRPPTDEPGFTDFLAAAAPARCARRGTGRRVAGGHRGLPVPGRGMATL